MCRERARSRGRCATGETLRAVRDLPAMTTEDSAVPARTDDEPGRRRVGLLLGVAAVVLALDQLTKSFALSRLDPGEPVQLIGDLLRLQLTFNPGAAFSLAEGYTVVLTVVAAAAVGIVLRISRRLRSVSWAVALGGLLGGALGNLVDRMIREPGPLRGQVVDFIQLPHFPVFNLADSAIVGAAGLMVLLSMRGIEYDGRVR